MIFLKKVNKIVKGCNTIILALVNGYRLNDRINTFKILKIQFNELNHLIDSIINKSIDGEIDKTIVEKIIFNHDSGFEDIAYQFSNHMKNKVIKKFGDLKGLPNSVAIDYSESNKTDIVIRNDLT